LRKYYPFFLCYSLNYLILLKILLYDYDNGIEDYEDKSKIIKRDNEDDLRRDEGKNKRMAEDN